MAQSVRVRLRIPEARSQEPHIYRLIKHHPIQVNIAAATMGADGIGDGWFDLELAGEEAAIEGALNYLRGEGLEIWTDNGQDDW